MPSPSDTFVHITDSRSIVVQVCTHIQRAYPALPPQAVLRIATDLELRIRSSATSRQDYVNRANVGMITILQSINNRSFPVASPPPPPSSSALLPNQAPPTPLQSPALGNLDDPYPPAETTMLPSNVHTHVPGIPTPTSSAADLGLTELEQFITAPSTLPLMGAPPATSLPAVSQAPSPQEQTAQPTTGTAPSCEQTARQQNDAEGDMHVEKKQAETSDKDVEETTARPRRRTTRRQTSRQPKRTASSLSNGPATPPTTRSRARKVPKRTPRKRPTRGRKKAVKQPVEPEIEENDKDKTSTSHSTLPGKSAAENKHPEAASSLSDKPDSAKADDVKCTANAMYTISQQHGLQKSKPDTQAPPHVPPTLECERHPLYIAGLHTPMGPTAPKEHIPNLATSNSPVYHYAELGGAKRPLNSTQIPTDTAPRPAAIYPKPNIAHGPSVSVNVQGQHQPSESVLFSSNGDIEIEDGIRVPKDQVIVAAASIGISLTNGQLQSLRRDQALLILVKASQLDLMRANGMRPLVASHPVMPQANPIDARRDYGPPIMNGAVHSYSNVQSPQQGLIPPNPEASVQRGIPTCSQRPKSSYDGTQSPTTPELRSAQRAQAPAQRSSPLWKFGTDIPEVQARLRKFQMDYQKYTAALQGHLSGITARPNDNLVRYLRCSINLLAMEPTHVRGVSVEVIDSVERFLRNFLNQLSYSGTTKEATQPLSVNGENGGKSFGNLNTSGFGSSGLPGTPQSVPQAAAKPFPAHSGPSQRHRSNPPPNDTCVSGADGTRNSQSIAGSGSEQHAETRRDSVTQHDDINSRMAGAPAPTDSNGKKRKASPNQDLEKKEKRVSTRMGSDVHHTDTEENTAGPQKRAYLSTKAKKKTQGAPADLIDITDEGRPPVGVAVYCQRAKNGNMFNLVRLSDRPNVEEVLRRLRFMLNCAMESTTCYIAVSEGKEEDNSRRLEEVVISLEPKKFKSDNKGNEDQPKATGLSMVDLINAECAEARKRFGSLTVQMAEEFGRPVFRGILRDNGESFPKLELHVSGNRKDEQEAPGYERPPMGWVGVLEHVRKLFSSTLEGGKGMEALIRRWIRSKEDSNGWMDLGERPGDVPDTHIA